MKKGFFKSASLLMMALCSLESQATGPLVNLRAMRQEIEKSCGLYHACAVEYNNMQDYMKNAKGGVAQFTSTFLNIDNTIIVAIADILDNAYTTEQSKQYSLSQDICALVVDRDYVTLSSVTNMATFEAICSQSAGDLNKILLCIAYMAESVERGTLANTYDQSGNVTTAGSASPLANTSYPNFVGALKKLTCGGAMLNSNGYVPLAKLAMINQQAEQFNIDMSKPNTKYQKIASCLAYKLELVSGVGGEYYIDAVGTGASLSCKGVSSALFPTLKDGGLLTYTLNSATNTITQNLEASLSLLKGITNTANSVNCFGVIGEYVVSRTDVTNKNISMLTLNNEGKFIKITDNIPEALSEAQSIPKCAGRISSGGHEYLMWAGGGVTTSSPALTMDVYKLESGKLVKKNGHGFTASFSGGEVVSGTITKGSKSYLTFVDSYDGSNKNRTLHVYSIGSDGNLFRVTTANNGGIPIDLLNNRTQFICGAVGKYLLIIGGKSGTTTYYNNIITYTISPEGYFVKGAELPLSGNYMLPEVRCCNFKSNGQENLIISNKNGALIGYTEDLVSGELKQLTIDGSRTAPGSTHACVTMENYMLSACGSYPTTVYAHKFVPKQ